MRALFPLVLLFVVAACAAPTATSSASSDPKTATVTAGGLHETLASGVETPLVVDVREPHEFEAAHIEGARLAPLGSVAKELEGVDRTRDIVLVCRSGNRSGKAQRLLAAQGFTKLRNMEGGMLAWEQNGYPVVKKPRR